MKGVLANTGFLCLCLFPYALLLQLPCTESHRCMMLERQCPRLQYLQVKAQVSRQWWMEVNPSASPTSRPHSHTSAAVECVRVCAGGGHGMEAGLFPTWLELSFHLGLDPGKPPVLIFSCSSSSFSASSSILPISSRFYMGRGWSGCVRPAAEGPLIMECL